MSDWVLLILVAWALYLVECLAWIGRDACACFRHPFSGRWRAATGSRLPGNDRGGLVVVSPASVSGALVVSDPWPLSIDPDGIANIAADAVAAAGTAQYIRFDAIERVEVRLGELHVNGRRFARLPSAAFGAYVADLILRVRRSARGNRGPKIRAAIAASLDGDEVAAAWRAFRHRTRVLATLCGAHLLAGFLAFPLVLLLAGPHRSWPYLLAAILLLAATTAVVYFRIHAKLYPDGGSDRWVHAISMVLLPVAAMRCVDKLSRDALCTFSPFAVAPHLCGAGASRALLREAWIDLDAARDQGSPQTDVERCVEWFRGLVIAETAAALERQGLALLAPPAAEDESMVSYCPRCHAQFGDRALDVCSECREIRLVRFGAA